MCVMNYTELEGKVREATNDEAWGPHGEVMQELANATMSYEQFPEVMGMLWKRMLFDNKRNWRRVYKSLLLLTYLIRHVRHKAHELVEFIQDDDKLREERKAARKNRDKYTGYSGNSFSGGSGFGSGGYGGGAFSDNYGGGGSGCGGSQLGEIDDWEGGRYRTMKDDVIDRVKDIWSARRPPVDEDFNEYERGGTSIGIPDNGNGSGGNGHLQRQSEFGYRDHEPTSGSSSVGNGANRRTARIQQPRQRVDLSAAAAGLSRGGGTSGGGSAGRQVIDLSGSTSAGANDDGDEFADFQSAGAQAQLSKQQKTRRGSELLWSDFASTRSTGQGQQVDLLRNDSGFADFSNMTTTDGGAVVNSNSSKNSADLLTGLDFGSGGGGGGVPVAVQQSLGPAAVPLQPQPVASAGRGLIGQPAIAQVYQQQQQQTLAGLGGQQQQPVQTLLQMQASQMSATFAVRGRSSGWIRSAAARPAVYQAQPAAAPQLKSPTSPTYPTSVNWGSGGAGSGGIGGARRAPSLQAKADQAFADLVSLK
uniref:ENTH domain-containing protein n=1 Tax=Macrostomum lignano TaxID=282301 RepID=A0A1I8F3H3_9PLAT